MQMHALKPTFKTAFIHSLPILSGFVILGNAYGIYMRSLGFDIYYPMILSLIIFAGSVEFIAASFLIGAFNPLYAFFITLMVSARQIFYAISMLEKYHQAGKKKFYLISATVDESFALIHAHYDSLDKHIDKPWYMLFITVLLHLYWVIGASLGAVLADFLPFSLKGSEFAMTALFLVIFLEQWLKEPTHESSLIGIFVTAICLIIFGAKIFLIPAMLLILIALTVRQTAIRQKFTSTLNAQNAEQVKS